ncbi:MAG: glycosyltransferase [bacterium]|nr:glycosyltransferase [bacterium]
MTGREAKSRPNVLLCGAWDDGDGYPRTAALRQGLERAGYEVRECRVPGLGRSKQKLLRQPWRWPGAMWRAVADRRRLRRQLRAELQDHEPQCVLVPYPGHHLASAIRTNTQRATAGKVPVVLDLFLSAYDTVVEDRRLCEPGSIGAWAMQELDRQACAAADLVLVDTPENAAYVAELTELPAERFAWLPLSDPEVDRVSASPFEDEAGSSAGSSDCLRVLFFGTGVPLHGLDVLVAAVRRQPTLELTLVGGTADDRAHATEQLGDRVTLAPEFVARSELANYLRACDVVAGVFGTTSKAQRVVPWKVVIALGAGRPVVTADTPAVCGWLEGSDAVHLTPAGDVVALAETLARLAADRAALAVATAAARPTYDRHFATARAAERWPDLLAQVSRDRASDPASVEPAGVGA